MQGRQFFDPPFGHAVQGFGGIEDFDQVAAAQPLHGQEMQQTALTIQLDVRGVHGAA